ncbi:hypothetical protein BH11MYX2_BH11MYX2_40570 [soil metagenome]
MPLVTYSEVGDQHLVAAQWPPVDGAATYFVAFYYGYVGQVCHVTESQHTFDAHAMVYDNRASVAVQAFQPVTEQVQPTGTLRIWIGDSTLVPVHTPY